MGWRTIIINHHAKVSLLTNNIVIQTDEHLYHVPADDIQLLIINSIQVVITSAVISKLSTSESKIIFTNHQKEPISEIDNSYPSNRTAELIEKQVGWKQSPNVVGTLWTKIAYSKIFSQIQVSNILGFDPQPLVNELNKMEFNDTTNREAVVAKKYFQIIFGKQFSREEIMPTNDALNYGYSILLSTVNLAITSNGNLTQIGIHHKNGMNEFNLGSDLMEPFRPIVDRWIAEHNVEELNPEIKFHLTQLLDEEINFNGKDTLLRNALFKHVKNCLKYLNQEKDNIDIKVMLKSEVSDNEIDRYV